MLNPYKPDKNENKKDTKNKKDKIQNTSPG